ncbi:Multimeric flavodoxin WrbA [Sporobacter termitidis DSM 10068]|uniref:Multimeric flavodoxin WrbA n=1 Tax=Sporobacter termitidis DSM 10068 TaxID=1123282 RepID=A0A1M5W902_9FIRM|nr:flavodoxin family protein [Sporobacter termitidis]SHH83945.1 Multimeric flavodoxin WrbA [Sporobacter termitidis DSM 10068]
MKTLIFNGSPRKKGNTSALVEELVRQLDGDVKIIRAYDCNVKPCIDCRFCWKNSGCAVKDGMQDIYDDIQEADNIIIASPTYFSELSGQLLAVLSRLQTYWCAKFLRHEEPVPKKKRGGIIVVRGGAGPLTKGIETAKVLLSDMNAKAVGTIFADNSDDVPSVEVKEALEGIRALADKLNHPESEK